MNWQHWHIGYKTSIKQSAMFLCSIVEENRQNVAPETITPQNILLSLIEWPHKYYFVH